jgi:hypothetical protein
VEGDERSRLHQIIDELSEEELPVARHLLELLARGLASAEHRAAAIANDDDDAGEDDEDEDEALGDPLSSPEMLAKLAQLTDDELLRLDALLESDREGARLFWRERFGEEMDDDPPGVDGTH